MLLLLTACDGGDGDASPQPGDPDYVRDPALNITLDSQTNGTSSHETGRNCMECHQAHGPGPGIFTAAGTLYHPDGSPSPNGTVELRTETAEGGELVLAIQVDANGNFYTTAPLPLPDQPLFPFVVSPDGESTTFMPFPTASAACNICHTGSQRIVVP
ncbi:MAG: hypothetical protein ACKO6N_11250 [Myxococcota bacterium]